MATLDKVYDALERRIVADLGRMAPRPDRHGIVAGGVRLRYRAAVLAGGRDTVDDAASVGFRLEISDNPFVTPGVRARWFIRLDNNERHWCPEADARDELERLFALTPGEPAGLRVWGDVSGWDGSARRAVDIGGLTIDGHPVPMRGLQGTSKGAPRGARHATLVWPKPSGHAV